ncbi:MAG TPA: PQQ-binding-like beta-propeller repeat protein [Tepidisphaeraceae bacterium]|nr:PQQ-binding-like beta-propeller repeat protein [Tepidisphaeraceae bacterium]
MKRALQLASVIVPVLFVFAASAPGAGDWPQWRGADRNGKAQFKAPAEWPGKITQKWKMAVGEGDSTPALADGKLYVFSREGGDEVTRCLDADSGKELWRDKYQTAAATGPAGRHPGPRSSPAVSNGKVITYGVRGVLSCLDAASGKVLWRKQSEPNGWPQFFTASSPLIADDLCIAQVGGKNDGSVEALDLGTGTQKWKWTGDGTAYGSPIVINVGGAKAIIAETDKRIVAIGLADGKLLWEKPYAGKGMGGQNTATPIFNDQILYYSGSGRGTTAAKLEKNGDAITATELWSNTDNSIQYNSPVLKHGFIYGLSDRNVLFCINAKDGKTAWHAPTAGMRGFGSVVDGGSVLLALTPAENLIVFEASDKAFKQLASYKVADSEIYASPVVAGNQVFVKDKDSVTLWTIQ